MILQRVIFCVLSELIIACASRNYSAQCKSPQMVYLLRVIQGEGLRLTCPNLECRCVNNDSLINWFKKENNGIQSITTEENQRVYYQGVVLYFLPLSLNDTGLYITQWWHNPLKCTEFKTEIVVDEKFHPKQLYRKFTEQVDILPLECPVWQEKGENITWHKDFHLIPNESGNKLKVYLPQDDAKGIYTCVCAWEHHGQIFHTSGSYQVLEKDHFVDFPPTFIQPTNNSVVTVDQGTKVKLNCLVFFGTLKGSSVYWMRDNNKLDGNTRMENDSMQSIVTIHQVSKKDLRYNYCCIATSPYILDFVCITLKTRDGKLYDAYVIYQQDSNGDKTERKVDYFVNKVLTDVLENACGFKLYIHGRDDLPGEDCTEFIEERMQLSRRLIAVLPSGVSQSPGVMTPLFFDWHVGLHQVLIEHELRVILIQLEEMKGYSHLPLALQHLLQKTPPLKWDGASGRATHPSSSFWKKLRYMMPVPSDSRSRDVQ
ncbi:Interleukin-1 receptor-like 1 [Bagarius yarrelli]|uniref:Interleukin-1 receptor-like 1 n=1 Tax=Bagarius yarrelli TaxID=175774 RepID=A0A556U4L3_BAGYA|nr:Interleukin-1 receptor-like 1 [Bagarius yarrelli]